MSFSRLLTDFYRKWRDEQFDATGREPNKTDFASYLGRDQATVNQWLSGRREPERKNVDHLADIIGPEVYDALGLPRPLPDDPLFKGLYEFLPLLDQDDKNYILEEAERRAAKRMKKEESDPKGVDKPLSKGDLKFAI